MDPQVIGFAASVHADLPEGHHPTQDCRVGQLKSTLSHHLHQVTKAQLEAQVSANAQHDDLALEVPTTFEQLIHALELLRHVQPSHHKGR